MRLIVSRAAGADFERLHQFLADKDPDAAGRAATAIDAAVQSLVHLPQRGRPLGTLGMRELIVPFGRSAYVLRYAYSQGRDELVIVRAWHSREERL